MAANGVEFSSMLNTNEPEMSDCPGIISQHKFTNASHLIFCFFAIGYPNGQA